MVAMRCDLVAAPVRLTYQVRHALRHPAQEEAGDMDAVPVELVEQEIEVALDA